MEPNNIHQPIQSASPQPVGEKSIGPAIGIIVIIAVIVLGGLYFWGQRIDRQKMVAPVVQQSTVSSANQDAVMQTSNADVTQAQGANDVVSIEAELNATNVNSVDPGVSEINAAVQ